MKIYTLTIEPWEPYDTDEETHTEFVATDEQGNKPLITVERAIALAAEDDEDDDDVLMSMEVADHVQRHSNRT